MIFNVYNDRCEHFKRIDFFKILLNEPGTNQLGNNQCFKIVLLSPMHEQGKIYKFKRRD